MLSAGSLGLMVDFDGTISEIAPTPDQAVASPRAAEALRSLVRKVELVGVVSGRAAHNVRDKLGVDGVLYVGNHGAEYLDAEGLTVAPGAAEYREKIGLVFDDLRARVDIAGLVWANKDYSASVHYRLAEDADQARALLQAALESVPGGDELEVFWGKMVLEIRAPIGVNKGYAVHKLARERELDAAIFLGDDTTDLDALHAIGELQSQGALRGVRVAVVHQDSPEELTRSADYGLKGVAEVGAFLEWLDSALGERGG